MRKKIPPLPAWITEDWAKEHLIGASQELLFLEQEAEGRGLQVPGSLIECHLEISNILKVAGEEKRPGPVPPGTKPVATIRIDWDVRRTSPNVTRGMKWQELSSLNGTAKSWAGVGYAALGNPLFRFPLRVDVLIRRAGRKMDDDNVIGGLKTIRDELVHLGLAPDDSPRWWQWGTVTQETGKEYAGNAHIILTCYHRER